MKQTTRFVAANGNGATLDIISRDGKTGISVFSRVRRPGVKAVIGTRSVFLPANETAAQEMFAKLVTDAEGKGWTRKTGGAGVTASQFNEIPSPDALPVGTPLAAKPAKPEAKKSGGKK